MVEAVIGEDLRRLDWRDGGVMVEGGGERARLAGVALEEEPGKWERR